jgi:hypothetical protein
LDHGLGDVSHSLEGHIKHGVGPFCSSGEILLCKRLCAALKRCSPRV